MKSDPFALQARLFTELRLLNREVEVLMEGLDRAGNIVGTVLHPKGNIAVEIVRCGLGRVHDRALHHVSKCVSVALHCVTLLLLLLCRHAAKSVVTSPSRMFYIPIVTTCHSSTHYGFVLCYLVPMFLSVWCRRYRETTLALRLAEREAQTKKVFIWSTVDQDLNQDQDGEANPLDAPGTPGTPSSSSSSSSSFSFKVRKSAPLGIKQFEGLVTEVLSGDTFMVLEDGKDKDADSDDDDDSDGEGKKEGDSSSNAGTIAGNGADSRETRVTLSSIR